MTFTEALANAGTAANTTALQRWAYAMNDYLVNGNGTLAELKGLFDFAGVPAGSAFWQWAQRLMLDGNSADARFLGRLTEQKPPAVGASWVDVIDYTYVTRN